MTAKTNHANSTERLENRPLLVESSPSFPRYAVLLSFVCLIVSGNETFSAASLLDLRSRNPDDMVATNENGYHLFAATLTGSQRKIRIRHDLGAAGRQLVNMADFSDPKSVELKNQYNDNAFMQPPPQLRGTPSSLNGPIEQVQRIPQPIHDEQPQEYVHGAAASQSAVMQTSHKQKNEIDYFSKGYTEKFIPEDSIRKSPEGDLGLASTPKSTLRGTDINPSQTSQSQSNGIIINDAEKSHLVQNQQEQLIIQHPLKYSQGAIASKVYETHGVKRSNDKLLSQGPETTSFHTASELTGRSNDKLLSQGPETTFQTASELTGHQFHLSDQDPLKYSQTNPTETQQNQLQNRPPELGNNNPSQKNNTFQIAQGHANSGREGETTKTYQEEALNYQVLPQAYSKSEVGGQNTQNIFNVNDNSASQDRSQRPTVQAAPQSSQSSVDRNSFQTIAGQQQFSKSQAASQLDEITNSQTSQQNQDNLAAANKNEHPPGNLGLEGFRDTWDLPLQSNDLPVFWKIPRCGGQTVVDILGQCHRFVMATDAGILDGHGQDSNITVLHVAGDGGGATSYVNVDTTTTLGLQRAKRLGLIQKEIARVIVVQNIFDANELFDDRHRGRLFALFRHPIDRAISTYNYLKYADWEPTYDPEIAGMTLKQYAQSKHAEFNWMTRALSSAGTRNVTEEHFKAAMDVIHRKFLVGLLNRKDESMERFEKYFEWIYSIHPKNQEKCRVGLLAVGSSSNINPNKVEKPLPGTPTYQLLVALNEFDIRLYKYVESLFDEQANFVKLKEDGFRLDGALCCKCDESC